MSVASLAVMLLVLVFALTIKQLVELATRLAKMIERRDEHKE